MLKLISYYSLPPFLCLWFLLKPLLGRFEKIKVLIVVALAISVIIPYKFVLNRNIRFLEESKSVGFFASIPIEEYISCGLQAFTTAFWTLCCTRFTVHSFCLRNSNRYLFNFIRYSIACVLLSAAVCGWTNAHYGHKTFHLGFLMWWYLPFITCIWLFAGHFIRRQYVTVLISVAVPTIWYCLIDLFAVRKHVWRLDKNQYMGIYIHDNLMLEDLISHLLLSILIVFASSAFDKSKAILDTFYPREQLEISKSLNFQNNLAINIKRLKKGLLTDEIDLPMDVIDDLENCYSYQSKAIRKLLCALPNDISQDAAILNAFCRTMDNLIDKTSPDLRQRNVQVFKIFLDEVYQTRNAQGTNPVNKAVNWNYLKKYFTNREISVFRSFERIAFYLPKQYIYMLIEAFAKDAENKCMEAEQDLIQYCKNGGPGGFALAITVCYHKASQWPDENGPITKYAIEKASQLGVAIHIIDIACDIIEDSEQHGQCYIPVNYLRDNDYNILTVERNPAKIENKYLNKYAEKIVDLSQQFFQDSVSSIKYLPPEFKRIFLGLLLYYMKTGEIIKNRQIYEPYKKSILRKVLVHAKAVYFINIDTFRLNCKTD